MMSSLAEPQTPLPTVHRSVALVPAGTPVIVVEGDVGFVMAAVPEMSIHKPLPTPGELALMANVLLLHCSISNGPASATGGVA